jgi:prepilin-type N-terminal cleavage/methylation domain-containing protein
MGKRNGFTLIEIMVSLVVFGIVMTAMTSAFYKTYKDWQRQRDYDLAMENARWAMEFMSNEIKSGHADANVIDNGEDALNDHELLNFLVDPTGHGNPHNKKNYYWRGKTGLGVPYVLYRSQVNSGQDLTQAKQVNKRQELCRFVVDGTDLFNVYNCSVNNCSVAINLTVRPKPDQPEGPGNRNYSFRTLVRPRN